jgi:Tfp pilus assembly protein PilF
MKKKYLIILLFILIAQSVSVSQQKNASAQLDVFKKAAADHMNAGRYGEAIDMLNKYVAGSPRTPDGYYMRGLCREKRSEFFNAVEDFRHAYQLCNDNQGKERSDIQIALNRTLDTWHKLLYKKVEGHKREIAINPTNPLNYLELGRSYKNLEKYDESEQWYDEYLKRIDLAPVDNILNYTEVIARTRHLEKGEKILKKYLEKYPEDHRLLSNYGYFCLWLGKFKLAEQQFQASLKIKPFFKEAQDGLDRARMEAYMDQYDPRLKQKAFPIDVYYRNIKKDPNDNDSRAKLIDELIKYERIEEAYKQLMIIRNSVQNDPKIEKQWSFVQSFRDTVYRQRIEQLKGKIESNPNDKASIIKITDYYDFIQDYPSAIEVLTTYLDNHPDEKDTALRYRLARLCAWGKDWDKSYQTINKLLEEHPDNIDYQLLKGQILIWIPRDTVTAKAFHADSSTVRTILTNVIEARPDNLEALMAMGQFEVYQKNFAAAQEYSDKAKAIDPYDDNVRKLQEIIDFSKSRYEEEKNYAILQDGRTLVIAGKPEEAIPFYLDYISKSEPNILITRELGDVYYSAKHYDDAKKQYDQVLISGFDYDAAMARAKLSYATGDSLAAAMGFKQIITERPNEYEPHLYLGDSYLKMKMYDSAKVQYELLSTWSLDSTQTADLKLRKGWIPVTGLKAILESFPNYIGVAPQAMFYSDNLSFRIAKAGARVELGVSQFLSIGASFFRTRVTAKRESLVQETVDTLSNFSGDQMFTTFKGHIFLTLSDEIKLGVGLGRSAINNASADDVDAFIKFEREKLFTAQLTYQNCDAVLMLYSPYLIDQRLYSQLLKFEWGYTALSGLEFTGYYTYISVNDGNAGNDLQLRLGKGFYEYIVAGYEYMYGNYRYKSNNYYSPQNFESHSLFFRIGLEKSKEWTVTADGKVGYIPYGSLISLLGDLKVKYAPDTKLKFEGKLTIASTSRDKSSYKFMSIELSAFWAL